MKDENRYERTLSSIEHIEWVLGVPIGHSMISFSIDQFLLLSKISATASGHRKIWNLETYTIPRRLKECAKMINFFLCMFVFYSFVIPVVL